MTEAPNELELHQDLQRFTTLFVDRVTQATEALEAGSGPGVRDEALRKNLLYVASAIELATGPVATVNLLDMAVFIRLSRRVLERHYLPELYGERGRPLVEVFLRSEDELSELEARALTADQRAALASSVDKWLNDNPDQFRVEGVRFSGFASLVADAANARDAGARGIFASVKTASKTADQALLLSERSLFLVHRLPTVWRLQARLGAREATADALATANELSAPALIVAKEKLTKAALLGGGALVGLLFVALLIAALVG